MLRAMHWSVLEAAAERNNFYLDVNNNTIEAFKLWPPQIGFFPCSKPFRLDPHEARNADYAMISAYCFVYGYTLDYDDTGTMTVERAKHHLLYDPNTRVAQTFNFFELQHLLFVFQAIVTWIRGLEKSEQERIIR